MKKHSMSTKLSVTYAILIILLIGIAAMGFYSYNRSTIYEEGISNLTQMAASAMEQLDNRLTTMEQVTVEVLTHNEFLNNWQQFIDTENPTEENITTIKRILTRAFVNKSDIRRVIVFTEDGRYISTGKANAKKEEVIKKVKDLKENYELTYMNSRCFIKGHMDDWNLDSKSVVISEIKPIKDRRANIIGFIEVQQNAFYIENICNLKFNNNTLDVLVFVDSDNKLFYSNNKMDRAYIREVAKLTEGYKKIRETKTAIFATETSNFYQCRMVFILEKAILFNALYKNLQGILLDVFLLIIVTLSYILLVTRRIMSPINHLVKRMESIDIIDYNYNNDTSQIKDKETAILTNAFEKMMLRLKETHEREKQLQELHTKAIFSILQLETSPHFLYNALGGIANLCEDRNNLEAAEACYSLTEILKYASDYSSTVVSIRQEINNLNAYLKIMKSRYCERLDYNIETDPTACDIKLPKLTYQPIVENAIKYSLIENDHVYINISTEIENNKLIIGVKDNGCGIPPEKVKAIQEKVNGLLNSKEDISEEVQFGGLGLSGTIVRLAIYFDNRFSYELTENIDGGANIRFIIKLT